MRLSVKCLLALLTLGLSVHTSALTCSVLSAFLAFGAYGPLANARTDKTALGAVQIHCDGATTVTVRILANRTFSQGRALANAGKTLRYELYADAGYRQLLGDGTDGSVSLSYKFAAPGTCTIPVYGRIPRGQVSTTAGGYIAAPLLIIDWR